MPATSYSLTRRRWIGAACLAQRALAASPRRYSLAGIAFEELSHGRTRRRYLHIHGNETTAREVLREHLRTHAGKALLVVSEKRTVTVGRCLIDPNRMFSREGAGRSLDRYNPNLPAADKQEALDLLDRDRDAFVRQLIPPRHGLLVALHNNSEGYSMKDEIAISDEVAENDKENPHDFFLATNRDDYRKIAASPFNVVLQATVRSQDGSFSVLAATRGIRYVNIEAALGNLEKQRKMLEFLETLPA